MMPWYHYLLLFSVHRLAIVGTHTALYTFCRYTNDLLSASQVSTWNSSTRPAYIA